MKLYRNWAYRRQVGYVWKKIPQEDFLGPIYYNLSIMEADRLGKSPYDCSRELVKEVKDILLLCVDGLTEIKEASGCHSLKQNIIAVHQVRNILKYVPDKDRKAFATDVKIIYQASDEKNALEVLERVTEKWATTIRNWAQIYGEVSIMYDGRLSE